MVAIGEPARITYTNYRGETAERTITPKRVWYGISEWHSGPQWFLTAFDHDKNADHDFALRDFGPTNLSPTPVAPVSSDATGECGELETELWRCKKGDYALATTTDGAASEDWKKHSSVEEYVTRSQAEDLLAAARAALPILKGTAFKSGDGWKDTTKEGDICFVWNRMHPAPYAPGQYPRVGKEHWSASIENYTFEPATLGEVSKLFADLKADNAAERAEKEELDAECRVLAKRCIEKDARVKELEAECDEFADRLNQERKSHESAHNRAEALEAKLAAAEKALQPFAEHANERAVDDTGWRDKETVKIVVSIGDLRRARAALGGKPS